MIKTSHIVVWIFALSLLGCGGSGGGREDTNAPSVASTSPTTQLIKQTDVISIRFDESIDTTSLRLGGSFAGESDGGVWSQTDIIDDTLTITPKSNWSVNTRRTLVINAKDLAGNAMAELALSYDVYRGTLYYVSSTAADDTGDGLTPTTAKHTIMAAVSVATAPATVLVNAGDYPVSYSPDTRVWLKEGVSLYGGYSADFSARNPNSSAIIDESTYSGSDVNPNFAVIGDAGITSATLIDGFTLQGSTQSGANYTSAIRMRFGAAPTVQNNTINGGSGSIRSYGLYNNAASPTVQNNTLNGGSGYSTYGMYNIGSSPIVQNNTINGGSGLICGECSISYGMYNTESTLIIQNNIISGGSSDTIYGMYNNSSTLTIQNNTIVGGSGYSSTPIGSRLSIVSMDNNILTTQSSSMFTTCYRDTSTSISTSISMHNNNFVGCPVLYRWTEDVIYISTDYNTITEVNALSSASNNIAVAPLFVDQVGGDYHFSASSPTSVTAGGLNGVDQGWGFSDDKDGVTRPAAGSAWAIGAYESN